MFDHEHRIEAATERRYTVPFAPEMVFTGIGEHAHLLKAGKDYECLDWFLNLKKCPHNKK